MTPQALLWALWPKTPPFEVGNVTITELLSALNLNLLWSGRTNGIKIANKTDSRVAGALKVDTSKNVKRPKNA